MPFIVLMKKIPNNVKYLWKNMLVHKKFNKHQSVNSLARLKIKTMEKRH